MSAMPINIDELLRAAACSATSSLESNPVGDGAAPDDDPFNHSDAWDIMEEHLQARAEALSANAEPPGAPAALVEAMLADADLRAAYAALSEPMEPAATRLPEGFQVEHDPYVSPKRPEGRIERLTATLRCAMDKWTAVSVVGLEMLQAQMVLARGNAAAQPVAMQGRLGDYVVALSLTGNPGSGCVLDAQCQEIRAGQSSPRSVPSFCLRDEEGKRYHSRDRVARVELGGYGQKVFQLEVTGRKRGEIVLNLEANAE
jgi:hypothetical protein